MSKKVLKEIFEDIPNDSLMIRVVMDASNSNEMYGQEFILKEIIDKQMNIYQKI